MMMRNLSERDRRTLRLGVIGIIGYLVLFYGATGLKSLETRRAEYDQLTQQARRVRQELLPYENKVLLLEKLQQTFRIDVTKLNRPSLVAEASAAIQKAAQAGGVQLGPIRESPGSASAKELAAMQLEGVGQVTSVMQLLHQLQNLGFPLVIESVQLTPESRKPGHIKVTLQLAILNFEQWKGARRNA